MKPSYEELEQKLAESQREFRAADATIENLQMQAEKLAAENAGLKQNAVKAEKVIMSSKFDYWSDRVELSAVVRRIIETPATEAFMAEVRAQGVEMLVKHCEQKALEKSYDFFMDAGAVAAQFAAQLRKGVQS
ncbi:hypothetical protein [Enterobacter sp. CPE_E1214]|uniref:hypothetical protein n=1 Tax=unclassified Enterobacter TaxID=2608935 RepID=UPI0038900506